jgi:hypothetical protein
MTLMEQLANASWHDKLIIAAVLAFIVVLDARLTVATVRLREHRQKYMRQYSRRRGDSE